MQMKVTLKMIMAIVAPSGDYIRMANMTASAASAQKKTVTPVLRNSVLERGTSNTTSAKLYTDKVLAFRFFTVSFKNKDFFLNFQICWPTTLQLFIVQFHVVPL